MKEDSASADSEAARCSRWPPADSGNSDSGKDRISSNPQDLLAADMAGVPSTGDLTTPESVLRALGVRKHAFKMEHRAA